MEQITTHPALRYAVTENGITTTQVMESVLSEYTLSVYLNGVFYQDFHCIPTLLEELILGHLYTTGMIASIEDVLSYSLDQERNIAHVSFIPRNRPLKPLTNRTINPKEILELSNRLLTTSKTFQLTGNVHSVMLCQGETILAFSEDVDRYYAFDKTIGTALKNHVIFSETCIYTTGRIPSQITKKAIFAGIPVIISRSAPTDLTISFAKNYHITIIGFARGTRMNLYVPLTNQ